MLVGYARTSSEDQTAGIEAQERDLAAYGIERLYAEQVSSMAERAQLAACLLFLRAGDVLVVTKPDRLARSTLNLLEIEAFLRARKVGLAILSMGLNTLDGSPTTMLMLSVLARKLPASTGSAGRSCQWVMIIR